MVDVQHIKALIAQVTGDSRSCRPDEDWRDWRAGVEMGGAPAREELVRIGALAVPYLIENIEDNYVGWVLRDMGDAAVQLLIAALDDPKRRNRAIGVLSESRSTLPVINDTLWRIAVASPEEPAALALANRRDPRALDLLVALLDTTAQNAHEMLPDTSLYTNLCVILNALGSYGDARAVPSILPFLDWEESVANNWATTVRSRAAHALGQIGDARVVEPLLTRLERESHSDTRLRMAEALCRLGDPRVIPVVERVAREMFNPPILTKPLEQLKRRVYGE